MYRNFKEGSPEVTREWRSQISQVDKSIEQALKQSVKRSLQELSRAINGDSKSDPQSLFTVNILLDQIRVSYSPSMVNLTHSVNIVAKDVISVVSAVPRIKGFNFDQSPLVPFASGDGTVAGSDPAASVVKAEDDKQKSYYEMISDDTDILRIVVQIMNGMSSTATELQKYLSYWDKYKSLWEMDKEAYIRKYAKSNRTPAQFDVDITRYKLQQAEITGETSTHVINFVRIDCNAVRSLISMSKLIYTNAIFSSFRIVEGCANWPLPAIAEQAHRPVEPKRPSRAHRYIRPVQGDQAEVGRRPNPINLEE